MTRCKTQARKCRFRDAVETDERLIEQLIISVRHVKIQEKLLSRDDQLTLDIAMDIARTHEATLANIQQFTGETSISHLGRVNKKWPAHSNNQREDQPTCTKCGRRHTADDRCPSRGSKCNACGLLNHWKSVCRNQTPRRSQNEMPYRGRQSGQNPETGLHNGRKITQTDGQIDGMEEYTQYSRPRTCSLQTLSP